ncbi:hypothetical protein [Pseudooceanicola algae]|uniref:Uncharacterized protein n=1 Tax=Pseudooceanicola algae TaxID=1537215 RepID=A0A418SK96_9RHOB|nr:hypothetical protein [Pseudooceanicola algae]QPM89142.1 hypothetical protein PSAL_003530 [Pseudooceanicola algae]
MMRLSDQRFETGDEWVAALPGRLRTAAALTSEGKSIRIDVLMSPEMARQAARQLDLLARSRPELGEVPICLPQAEPFSRRALGSVLIVWTMILAAIAILVAVI